MDTPTKRCKKCGVEKPATREYFHVHHGYFLRTECRQCRAVPKEFPDPPEGMKRCTQCKQVLPSTNDYFCRNKNGGQGLLGKCRKCMNKQIQRDLHRTSKGKDCCKCGKFKPYSEYPRCRSSKDGYQHYCKECKNEKARESYQRNRQHCLDYAARYRVQHPDKASASKRASYYKKPMIYAAASWRRRARKLSAEGEYSATDVLRLYEVQKGRCYWCNKKVGKRYHVDHVIPLARGGSNDPSNLVISCPRCNSSKGAKLPHEWNGNGGKML